MKKIPCVVSAAAFALVVAPTAGIAGTLSGDGRVTADEARSLNAGVQVAPKSSSVRSGSAAATNPYLGMVIDQSSVDYSYWKSVLRKGAAERARSSRLEENKRAASGGNLRAPAIYDEKEIDGTQSNDSRAEAERIGVFGTAAGKNNRVRILGSQQQYSLSETTLAPVPEDNGSIPLAGDSGLGPREKTTTTGTIGDGPHGSAGDGTGDVDFYSITAVAGEQLILDTSGGTLDTLIGLYSADGTLLAVDDDAGSGLASLLTYDVTESGTYYAAVVGYKSGGSFPADPMDSGSGNGVGREGDYPLAMTRTTVDKDFYAVWLRPGDVLGGSGLSGADSLTVFRPDGTEMVGAEEMDASFLYPPNSPLPGAGTTALAYVAEQAGWYALQVDGAQGDYQVAFEAYRPGGQLAPGPVQRIFLDFNGQRVNTAIWGGSGVRTLSPFNAFLSSWGLSKSQERELINKITTEVNENLKWDLRAKGLNPNVQVTIVNSQNSADIYGKARVSRVIVGGTIAESGISTIGIAQYIDPGNYAMDDQALVLLDAMSEPSGPAYSLNTYMNESSDRVAFVSQAVGNVVAHEVGHLIGNYHTNNTNETANLMDAGGTGFEDLFGVGPDGVGGTADDTDTDFGTDEYIPAEGFTGLENTLNVSAWAFTKR